MVLHLLARFHLLSERVPLRVLDDAVGDDVHRQGAIGIDNPDHFPGAWLRKWVAQGASALPRARRAAAIRIGPPCGDHGDVQRREQVLRHLPRRADENIVHMSASEQVQRSFVQCLQRVVPALLLVDGIVRVTAGDEKVTELACCREEADVAGVEEVPLPGRVDHPGLRTDGPRAVAIEERHAAHRRQQHPQGSAACLRANRGRLGGASAHQRRLRPQRALLRALGEQVLLRRRQQPPDEHRGRRPLSPLHDQKPPSRERSIEEARTTCGLREVVAMNRELAPVLVEKRQRQCIGQVRYDLVDPSACSGEFNALLQLQHGRRAFGAFDLRIRDDTGHELHVFAGEGRLGLTQGVVVAGVHEVETAQEEHPPAPARPFGARRQLQRASLSLGECGGRVALWAAEVRREQRRALLGARLGEAVAGAGAGVPEEAEQRLQHRRPRRRIQKRT
mmetsp:Transcript_67849/g.196305  ORF Transcript_67849/g.196305 Transcript_67849/m.196305 type:complete len:449 (-) Transcript_67849:31-1377(-)